MSTNILNKSLYTLIVAYYQLRYLFKHINLNMYNHSMLDIAYHYIKHNSLIMQKHILLNMHKHNDLLSFIIINLTI